MFFLTMLSRKSFSLMLLALFIVMLTLPSQAQAQWPPFTFRMTPTHQDGKIIYDLIFRDQTDGNMLQDVVINIPTPEGTRFLEGTAQPSTSVTFNGNEVSFFTANLPRGRINTASFTVEIVNPTQTEFNAHAWIAWKGDASGDYLTEDYSIDITKKNLDWREPDDSRLRLRTEAIVKNSTITYNLFPYNTDANRMWDLEIKVPVPQGTTFLSSEAPSNFSTTFDGREVTFFTIELPLQVETPPLSFTVSTEGVTDPVVVTRAWATWKNSSRQAVRLIDAQENLVTGDIVVQPGLPHKVSSDVIGDVPFSNYDIRSIAIQDRGSSFDIVYYTVGQLCPTDAVLHFEFYIDTDCNPDTGRSSLSRGVEYQARYRADLGRADIRAWDPESGSYNRYEPLITGEKVEGGNAVRLSIPYEAIGNSRQFCWVATARDRSDEFSSSLPQDYAYTNTAIDFSTPTQTSTPLSMTVTPGVPNLVNSGGGICSQVPTTAPLVEVGQLSGKIAVPLYNDSNLYDVHVFSVPDGQEITKIENARQPNIRFDGQKMLTNRMGGGVEDLYEYSFVDGLQQQVGNGPQDTHPFYDKDGNRVVFGNAELTVGADGERHPFIFVQCSLMPPYQETDVRCKNLATFGVLVPAGQTGDLQGSNPVWTDDDRIAYKGCDTWAGSRHCGIYVVPSSSTKGFSNGLIPTRVTNESSDIPSDTHAGFVTFTTQRDGDWEAYVVNLDGSGLRNLSNSPTSSDGLPTISPDGGWVAFVSNRDGWWAVWITPLSGGEATKLFDLPDSIPWGAGADDWQTERISWGP